jgi:indole-3-glycerol phosphate synthase
MADILAKICADKRDEIARRKAERPLSAVESAAKAASAPRPFRARLEAAAASHYGLIAEIKRASPSRGLIRADFDPPSLARAYGRAGASCLSVLTDAPYFQGSDAFLQEARAAVDLPVLRKDFMLEPYQIAESRALGADCVLLIMAALDDGQARELEEEARRWKMDVLVEVHDDDELDRALKLDARLVGINNRNLKSLAVDVATTEHLAPRVPKGRTIICESGLKTTADLERMARVGVRCFLVGESLMAQPDVEEATRALLGTPALARARAL